MKATSPPLLSESILRTILYYDIFSYPLTSEEVYKFLPTNGVSQLQVDHELSRMILDRLIFRHEQFYSVRDNPDLASRRIRGNTFASATMKKASRRARLISRFPFVRGVFISGSLSKGFMDEKSDVDFFIVTAPGRLWIARTILVLFKRLVLMNSHKYFCVNYFVDTNHLEIGEKNLFTATELATLLPMVNAGIYQDIMSNNGWLKSFFPNYVPRSSSSILPTGKNKLRTTMEGIINLCSPSSIEAYFKEKTLRRWKTLYEKDYNKDDFDVAFKTNDHVSKNHPRNYQKKVIAQFELRIAEFELPLKSRRQA